MKKLKGIISFIISISVIFLMMPFNIYADTDITVQYNSSESEWASKMSVTNYCDGTNTQASCKLTFTLNDNYYGYVMFNAYNNDTQIYTNQYVYVAAGIGEYNYLFYQNGVKPITKIYVSMTNLFLRGANIDLSEVVQLLTLINSSNQAIYSNSVTIRNNLISVLEEEIEANGYLEFIQNLRQWNYPIESMSCIYPVMQQIQPVDTLQYNYFNYPIFEVNQNIKLFNSYYTNDTTYDTYIIMMVKADIYSLSRISDFFTFNADAQLSNYTLINRFKDNDNTWWYTIKFQVHLNTSNAQSIIFYPKSTFKIIPIYFNRISYSQYISTDFALMYGLTNTFLDNIQIIANGTSQSQSAASGLEQSNNQMAQDMNNLATIESGYNQQFNNSLQTIDFTNPVQSNQGMLPAANFVISVFNGLISNNPFSVLIIVVCILLIGKKVIGK